MSEKKPQTEPSWKWRRVVVFISIAFCNYMLWRLMNAPDTGVNQTIASGLIFLVGVIICGYLGFATAQDVAAIYTTKKGMPYDDRRSYRDRADSLYRPDDEAPPPL